jgi:hypothetical protein
MKTIHTYKTHDKFGITILPIQNKWGRYRYLFKFDLSFFGNKPPYKPIKSRYYLSVDLFWMEFDFRIGTQGSWKPNLRFENYYGWKCKRNNKRVASELFGNSEQL